MLNRGFAFAQDMLQVYSPLTRLGWKKNEPAPLNFPSGSNSRRGSACAPHEEPCAPPDPRLATGNGGPALTGLGLEAHRVVGIRAPNFPVPRSPRCSIRSTLPRMLRFRSKVTGVPPGATRSKPKR